MLKEGFMVFSEIISSKRRELGMTQDQVAELLHVSRQALSNWEKGKNYPDLDTLVELSKIYDLSLDVLIKGDKKVMKKVQEDSQDLRKQKKLRVLDISLAAVIVILILVPVLLNFFGDRNILNGHLMSGLMFILIMYIMIASLWHYHLAYPGPISKQAPILIPKSFGIGLTINPQSPIGLAIWIILLVIIVIAFMPMIF
ncbi:XRE family transcriptional regulator [Oenococcus oeni S25]|uniref:helix-turn-helix domain-containing protein n=1 Tax=Oenococcus oeni TaxID=1247 RepID=UPI00050F1DB0|nr:helix-turn-helix transcriptional regulator [Oenococcus oeni]KGH56599.1 XRE family transcriptional regulator [Oenococcus oeni S22]KGH71147.1 XRE family transcriptional regulator [Oenococcus oeni S25]KGH80407.1 XRE family transcriptional regulator [Oenococcus oeni IOEB_0607]KGH90281.1 XRE family transcriptional regulator [Oenococcus oeni IOEB_L26_1]KMQ39086.1 XRE family transcriptional regulator [Oenococcus oeni]